MRKFLTSFIMAILAMFSIQSFAQTVTDYYLENIQTTDTYIRSSLPDNSFGTSTSLITGGWGDMYISLVKFNIVPIPLIATGDKVSVWFYNISPGGAAQPTQVSIGLLASDFSDNTTWNSAGLSWYTSTVRAVNVGAYGSWTEFDITDYFNYWKVGGVANYGFAIVPVNTNNYFNFFQSSSTSTPTSQKPFLRITKANSNRMFGFPLKCSSPLLLSGTCPSGTDYSSGAYTPQRVISVLDHDMSALYTDKNGSILTFTGEYFKVDSTHPADIPSGTNPQACYLKQNNAVWSSTLQSVYVGTGAGYSSSSKLNCSVNIAINYEAHPGYDYKASQGTEVYAVADGVVVNNTISTSGQVNTLCVPKGLNGVSYKGCSAWGAVGIDHGGLISQYVHLSSILVKAGQAIKQGDLIGYSGDKAVTGNYHLHFEVLKLRSGYANDYQPASYATVDPYGFNLASGQQDVLANNSGVQSVCLWISGCTNP